MSSKKPYFAIQAIDNKGNTRNLSCNSWSKITGHTAESIRARYHRKCKGKDLSNRQVVGLDDLEHFGKEDLIKSRILLGKFNRRRLTDTELVGMSAAHWSV